MKYLVDSETVIDFFKGKTELFHLFDDTENVFISAMSVGILYEKVLKADNPDEKLEISKDFCQLLNVLPVNDRYIPYNRRRNSRNWAAVGISSGLKFTPSDREMISFSTHPKMASKSLESNGTS